MWARRGNGRPRRHDKNARTDRRSSEFERQEFLTDPAGQAGVTVRKIDTGGGSMEAASTVLVEARSLRKDYGTTRAVEDISFKVSRGEVVGFLGPNGAGKSTTMKMLTGYLRPSAGSAVVAGIDVGVDPLAAKRLIGYLPENAPLYDDMMVIDFLSFVADLRGLAGETRHDRLRTICKRCGLTDVLGKNIGQLSKGFRQRVGLAQAMVHDPDLLILDEPTSGLDPNQIVEIRELIKELGREKTVILSTHILPEVQASCGRIIIINAGKLVADDTPDVLTGMDAHAVIRLVAKGRSGLALDEGAVQAALTAVPGVAAVERSDGEGAGTVGFRVRAAGANDPREAIFRAAVDADFVLLDLHRERVSLEETFRQLTVGEGGKHA
jgi:ABC-2 type transport system ATP-binding protein